MSLLHKHHPDLPHNPFHIGEITGYRAWFYQDVPEHGKILTSISFQKRFWLPNDPIQLAQANRPRTALNKPNKHGFYSFKERSQLIPYLNMLNTWWRQMDMLEVNNILIIGTVDHWGEVVEHRLGYRSEYAAIRSLDEVCLQTRSQINQEQLLNNLRNQYHLNDEEQNDN